MTTSVSCKILLARVVHFHLCPAVGGRIDLSPTHSANRVNGGNFERIMIKKYQKTGLFLVDRFQMRVW